jgi:hypothetical protein
VDQEELDSLKQRYGRADWPRKSGPDGNLLVWQFFLTGTEFPGWQAHRIQPVSQSAWPPFVQSIWKPREAINAVFAVRT